MLPFKFSQIFHSIEYKRSVWCIFLWRMQTKVETWSGILSAVFATRVANFSKYSSNTLVACASSIPPSTNVDLNALYENALYQSENNLPYYTAFISESLTF